MPTLCTCAFHHKAPTPFLPPTLFFFLHSRQLGSWHPGPPPRHAVWALHVVFLGLLTPINFFAARGSRSAPSPVCLRLQHATWTRAPTPLGGGGCGDARAPRVQTGTQSDVSSDTKRPPPPKRPHRLLRCLGVRRVRVQHPYHNGCNAHTLGLDAIGPFFEFFR